MEAIYLSVVILLGGPSKDSVATNFALDIEVLMKILIKIRFYTSSKLKKSNFVSQIWTLRSQNVPQFILTKKPKSERVDSIFYQNICFKSYRNLTDGILFVSYSILMHSR